MKLLFSLLTLAIISVGCGETGSESGAGGAGPGYDGSSQGTGKEGTVPEPGSGVGAGWTNSESTTNRQQ